MDRRDLLKLSAATAGVVTLAPVSFAQAAEGGGAGGAGGAGRDEDSRTVTGHLEPGAPDFVYLPVDVPRGVREIHVSYDYDRPEVPAGTTGNALDIGIFDERGTGAGGRGFRGWSGGFRTEFAISADRAATTPAYLPGPVRAGRWHVVLGPYTVAPQGLDYEVTVTLRYGPAGETAPPRFPPERARGRGRAWYRGDCHLHTVHSDGARTPAETAAAARAAKLDFIATTEHNTSSGHAAWEGLWGDDLLVLCGEEVTTRNGHYLAVGTDPGVFVDWRYRARDDAYARYVRQIHAAGGLVVPAHPNCPFVGCQWKFGYEGADAVEVWNGPWTADDELAVAAWDNALTTGREGGGREGRGGGGGWNGGGIDWLPAVGNSDAHRDGQVVGLPQTVVLAEDLSRQAVLAGLRAGRSWLAESAEVDVEFTASGPRGEHAGIGERLRTAPEARVTARLEVSGAPADAQVRFMTDEGQLYATTLAEGAGTVEWRTTASYAAFVRAEVRHPVKDGGASGLPGAMAAMTNPVWLGR